MAIKKNRVAKPGKKAPARSVRKPATAKKAAKHVKKAASKPMQRVQRAKPAKRSTTIRKAASKKAPVRAAAAKKAAAKKTTTRKAVKETVKVTGKTTAQKSESRVTPAKPAPVKAAVEKPTGARPGAAGKPVAASRAPQVKPAVGKAPGRKAASSSALPPAPPPPPPVLPPSGQTDVVFVPYAERPGEEYMNPDHVEHFRTILMTWRQQLMEEVERTVHHMQDDASNFPDPNDRATQEEEFALELRTRDRERKLIKKINDALTALENGEYGYCEMCGIEIGIRRLEARPTATLCIDCKTLDEIRERQRA